MKKNSMLVAAALLTGIAYAQQSQGKIVYERTIQMRIQVSDDHMAQMLPPTRTDKFELAFGGNKSLWKHAEEEMENTDINNNGMQLKIMTPGQDDIVFYDFTTARKVEQREMFDKKFILEDTIAKLSWKLTGETQTILNHLCQKATAQKLGKRSMMTMENGKMEKKDMADTSNYVAWFTTDIPVSTGPEVQGQLPGVILSLDINNGRTVYKALSISPATDLASIKEPTKGKKVTQEEFRKEIDTMMSDLQKNSGGGNRQFRMN